MVSGSMTVTAPTVCRVTVPTMVGASINVGPGAGLVVEAPLSVGLPGDHGREVRKPLPVVGDRVDDPVAQTAQLVVGERQRQIRR